jgi:transposase-like protein
VSPARPPTPDMTCPFCESVAVERVGQWGGQLITSQWRCLDCGAYFEALREDYAAARVTSSSDAK